MDEKRDLFSNVIPIPVFQFNFSTKLLFRCTRREWAEQIRKGKIYFGSPRQWVELEKKGNKGQGDLLEGVFMSALKTDDSDFIKAVSGDPSIENFIKRDFRFFRRKSILDLRCLCLYGVHDNCFHKEYDTNGKASYSATVTKDYFADFTDNKTAEQNDVVATEKQSVVLIIGNPHVFFSRIREFLYALDVRDEEIIISPVEYLDRYKRMISAVTYPRELLLKHTDFKSQSEVRVIINSRSKKYLDYMREHDNMLDVGSLEDITEIYDYYYDDMSLVLNGNTKIAISLPKAQKRSFDEMDFLEMIDCLVSILEGGVKIQNLPEDADTWEEKLAPLIKMFCSRFGVYVSVDENKHVSMTNLSQELLQLYDEKYKNGIQINQFERQVKTMIDEERIDEAVNACIENCDDKNLIGVAHYWLGIIFEKENRGHEAIEAFLAAYNNDYKRTDSLINIASIHFQNENYEEAIKWYYMIQDEKGFDSRIWCNIGVCYDRLKQHEKAIEFFDKGIEFDNTDAYPYYYKGVAYYYLGQYDKTKEYMEKAVELDPSNEVFSREYNRFMNYLAGQ